MENKATYLFCYDSQQLVNVSYAVIAEGKSVELRQARERVARSEIVVVKNERPQVKEARQASSRVKVVKRQVKLRYR